MQRARLVDMLCQRWHCPPRQVMEEDAHELFLLLAVLEGQTGKDEAAATPVPVPQQPALDPVMAELAALSTALA